MTQKTVQPDAGAQISQVPVGALVPPRHNHRRTSSEEGLRELADSIRARGVLEPIIVRPGLKAGTFEIVAGWRRYLASKLAAQETIPAIIRSDLDDAAAAKRYRIDPEVVRRELREKDDHTRRVSRLRGGRKKAKA